MGGLDKRSDTASVGGNQVAKFGVVALAKRCSYDFGDVFYEPVAEITESGWSTYEMEAWARKHEVKRIELDSQSWVKTAHYYGELGEINIKDWFTDKQLCQEAALMMAEELVKKEIAEAQHKSDKALQEKNKLQAMNQVNDLPTDSPETKSKSSEAQS